MASTESPEGPECIAWYNGSFAPPTNAHINSALALAKTFLSLNPGKRCRFCIIPTSNAYKKASIQCTQDEYPVLRKTLCELFAEIVKTKASTIPEFSGQPIDFIMETHELDSPKNVNAYESLLFLGKKYGLSPSQIFIAQGQDNIDEYIKMNIWGLIPPLMEYPVIMMPRSDFESEEKWKRKTRDYMTKTEPPFKEDDTNAYLERVFIVKLTAEEAKYLYHSSTFIRELLRQLTAATLSSKREIINSYINEDILSIILSNPAKDGRLAYTNITCESNGIINLKTRANVSAVLKGGKLRTRRVKRRKI
jgi:nicotinic acid mononucleotide adenylyltransferase